MEVESRSTRVCDREYKRPAYLALGVPEVWRVALEAQVVLVTRRGEAGEVPHRGRLPWEPHGLPRALDVDLTPVFDGVPPAHSE